MILFSSRVQLASDFSPQRSLEYFLETLPTFYISGQNDKRPFNFLYKTHRSKQLNFTYGTSTRPTAPIKNDIFLIANKKKYKKK